MLPKYSSIFQNLFDILSDEQKDKTDEGEDNKTEDEIEIPEEDRVETPRRLDFKIH